MGCCLTDRSKNLKEGDGPIPTDPGIGDTEEENKEFLQHGDKFGRDLKTYQTTDYDEDPGLEHLDGKIEDEGGGAEEIGDKKHQYGKINLESSRESKKKRMSNPEENPLGDNRNETGFRNRQQSITDLPAEVKEKFDEGRPENSNFSFRQPNRKGLSPNHASKNLDNLFNSSKGNEDNEIIVEADKKFHRQKSGKSNETASFMENLDSNDIREGYYTFENNLTDTQKFSSLNLSTMTGISRKQDDSYSFLENSVDNIVQMTSNHSTYFSINSTSIMGNNYYTEERHSHILQEPHDVAKLFCRNFIFFYFEFHYFSLWGKEYLSAIYPELNIIMVIEINDSKVTQEKIPLIKSKKKEKGKEVRYYPELKKQDMNTKVYRIIQAFDVNQTNRDTLPFKINISFYTFTNHKMLLICNDEIFLLATRDGEMQKYTMLRNTYAKHYHKKLGNVLFNFAYKSDDLSPSELEYEKQKMLKNFFELKDFSKFEENPELNFKYFGIENMTFRENGAGENGDFLDSEKNFMTIKEIMESIIKYFYSLVESNDDIKNENNLEKLLDMLMTEKKKFEFYQILKRLNDFISTSEFREAKLIKFKEILTNRLQEFAEKTDTTDKILVPFIFGTLKNAFFKTQSQNGGSRHNKKRISKKESEEKNKPRNLDFEKTQNRNVELMTDCIVYAFSFLRNDINEDVCLSALNYIHRYLEESIPIPISNRNISVQEYYLQFIVDKKYYTKFFDTLLRYHEYSACVQPIYIMFRKILKSNKEKVPELIQLFNNEKFKEVFRKVIKTHDCNGLVMTNIFHILQHIAVTMDQNYINSIIPLDRLKEVFSIFKNYGYEQFHESAVNLIKVALLRKISKGGEMSSKQTFNTSVNINVTNEEHSEIVQIFSSALTLMNRKLGKMENSELRDWMNTMLSNINVVCNVLQVASPSDMDKAVQIMLDKKIFDFLIDIFIVLRDRSIIKFIETLYKNNFEMVMQMKTTLLRTLYHLMDLFVSLGVFASMLKPSLVDKINKLIETVRDNDKIYNPEEITRTLSRDENMVNDEAAKLIKKIEYYYAKFNYKCKEFFKDPSEVISSSDRKRNLKQR